MPGDGDPNVPTVQPEFDGGVLQRAGDLGGQVGQRIHDGEAGGGFQGAGQQGGGAAGSLVADRGGGEQVIAEVLGVGGEIHDTTMTPP